jgi:hypothetical protein
VIGHSSYRSIFKRSNPIFQIHYIDTNTNTRYLKKVDSFQNNHIHTFITGGNVKFMLLMNADPLATPYSNFASPPPSRSSTARQSTLLANNPGSSQTEDAVRGFVTEVSHARIQPIYLRLKDVTENLSIVRLIMRPCRSMKHGSNAR